jgi:hypothetical protein
MSVLIGKFPDFFFPTGLFNGKKRLQRDLNFPNVLIAAMHSQKSGEACLPLVEQNRLDNMRLHTFIKKRVPASKNQCHN